MEKSSRRLRRQIREKMSSGMATGCLPGEVGAFSETHCPCAGLTGSPVCKQAPAPPSPMQVAAGGPLVPEDPGAPRAASASSLRSRSCQGICSERGKGSAFLPRIPCLLSLFPSTGQDSPRGKGGRLQPCPNPPWKQNKNPILPNRKR